MSVPQANLRSQSSPQIGLSLPRIEDDRALRGKACYVDDLKLSGVLHAAFARSTVARAFLRHVDIEAARRKPQVRAVFTGAMIQELPALTMNGVIPELRQLERTLLAVDRVLAVGEPIALVVADTAEAALEAVDLIEVQYALEEPLVDATAALAASSLMEEWPDNEVFTHHHVNGDPDGAFARASHRVQVRFTMPRVAPVALEPRGTLAEFRPESPTLTVWLGNQTPHRARIELARILGLELSAVRVIAPDVGGAFGGKASLYPEDVLVAWAAMQLRRPVKWIATRNEEFVSASHGRGVTASAEAALDEQGHFLALRADLVFPIGHWGTYSAAVPAWNAARILPGPYAIPAVDIRARGVLTNSAAVGIYRGAGRPEAAMLMERLIEEAGRACGLDSIEVRHRNLIPPQAFPYRTPTAQCLDSGDYPRLLQRTLELGQYAALRRAQVQRRADGALYGIGVCMYLEPCGQGSESARLSVDCDGKFLLACGTSSQGQGHRTALAQIAADYLNVPIERIDVTEGDTARTPTGVGAVASRSMAIGGSAVKVAAIKLHGMLADRDAACREPLEVSVLYEAAGEAWSAGCALATVSVDAETGELTVERFIWIDDAGVIVNPLLAHGQMLGGLAQGLGQILCEQVYYDASGQLLTGTLMDYALLRADQMPHVELHTMSTPTRANALGSKGVGESGCIVAPAAVYNAALDALRPMGVTELDIPLSSEVIWRAMRRAAHARHG